MEKLPEDKREAVLAVLADDPRPGYQNDPGRVYGMTFAEWDLRFTVDGQRLFVCEAVKNTCKRRVDFIK